MKIYHNKIGFVADVESQEEADSIMREIGGCFEIEYSELEINCQKYNL